MKNTLLYIDPLHDGISKVELIDYMGSDDRIVDAARVSMNKEADQYTEEQNDKLISYLAKHQHWTPFSHPQITLRLKMPIFVARQWFKHQVGFTRNEVSRRYVDDSPEFFTPEVWRKKAPNVKQGSLPEGVKVDPFLAKSLYSHALALYNDFISGGVCAEQARMLLPQSMYTEFYETGSLAAYARLCNLRLDSHAQQETRAYAFAVSEFISPLFPVSWAALSKTSTKESNNE